MRETLELRVPEENAEAFLPQGIGTRLGYGIRKVTIDTSDPIFAEIGRLQREFRARGDWFFHGWTFHRHYSATELAHGELFYVFPGRTFEPAGEECGTVYDDDKACPECGSGAPQLGPLVLDGRRMPKGPDIARTIADEIVVSSKLREVLQQASLSGAAFGSVALVDRRREISADCYQLQVHGPSLELDRSTIVGEGPFGEEGYGRCPRGDLVGLNLISEVSVRRDSLSGADMSATAQFVGTHRGLLRPRRLLLLSPRARQAILEAGLKGLVVEVAHLV
jgi:hypothetical protein